MTWIGSTHVTDRKSGCQIQDVVMPHIESSRVTKQEVAPPCYCEFLLSCCEPPTETSDLPCGMHDRSMTMHVPQFPFYLSRRGKGWGTRMTQGSRDTRVQQRSPTHP